MESTKENYNVVITGDGIPLKKKLARSLFQSRLRAFGLVTPLLLLIVFAFIIPILIFLSRGVYNDTFEKNMINLTPLISSWDSNSEPNELMFKALVLDLKAGKKKKKIGKVATREDPFFDPCCLRQITRPSLFVKTYKIGYGDMRRWNWNAR